MIKGWVCRNDLGTDSFRVSNSPWREKMPVVVFEAGEIEEAIDCLKEMNLFGNSGVWELKNKVLAILEGVRND